MPSTGSLRAPSTCLRCQLRQIILSTRLRALPPCYNQRNVIVCKGFSTSLNRRSEGEDEEDRAFLKSDRRQDERRTRYRREYPLGRIVGQPGRRQRERSETLKIDSMKRTFDVVLMQDIREPKEPPISGSNGVSEERSEGSTISAAEVASGLLNAKQKPTQDEVNVSIDALRPDANAVNEKEYNDLLLQLARGYNTQQLSEYLAKFQRKQDGSFTHEVHSNKTSKHRDFLLSISSWQPGRTPLETRHEPKSAPKQSKSGLRKKRITNEIIRSAWNLSIRSEEEAEEIGELEISLASWQLRYLFDVRKNDRPNYEHLIEPQLLLRRSEVLPYRPDPRVRIVARRRDAEEIVDLIVKGLRQIRRLYLDLNPFKAMLGTPGWPNVLTNLFPGSSLRSIEQHTMSVIEPNQESIRIYNKSEDACQHAKRLLLSLLQLPSAGSTDICQVKSGNKVDRITVGDQSSFFLPEGSDSSLHFRHRGLTLHRLTVPTSKSNGEPSAVVHGAADGDTPKERRIGLSAKLVESLKNLSLSTTYQRADDRTRRGSLHSTPKLAPNALEGSYWRGTADSDAQSWAVQICKVLMSPIDAQLERTRQKTRSSKRRLLDKPIIQSNVPGIDTLLSYFTPMARDGYAFDSTSPPTYLVAHLCPSPFAAEGVHGMALLPRVELWYQLSSLINDEQSSQGSNIRLSHVQAVLDQQQLRVLQPEASVDLQFFRKLRITADVDKIVRDERIARFSDTVRQSASDESGPLAGQSSLKLNLPTYFVDDKVSKASQKTGSGDVEVEYLFLGFEQVQTTAYVPMQLVEISTGADPAIKQLLRHMTQSMFLEYRSIEGGIIGGNRGELTLKHYDATMPVPSASNDGELRARDLRLVDAALSLAGVVTEISAGRLRSFTGSAGSF